MCGIIGYTGSGDCLPVLIGGLRALEYRGYDSAGISFSKGGEIKTVKTCGKLSALEKKLKAEQLVTASCGIGHTRWATHGATSDLNAHPHSTSSLSLVHNGIIENYVEIEDMLKARGYSFVSDTDTERALCLIDLFYSRTASPITAIREATRMLRGSYAFGIIFSDLPDRIFAIRKDSPLIVAKSDNGALIASDIPAILSYTKKYCRIDEGVIAELTESEITFYDGELHRITQRFEEAEWSYEQAQKGGFPHFMLKEIYEQPSALEITTDQRISSYLPSFSGSFPSDELLGSVTEIHVVACGTAMHAGLVGKHLIESFARIKVNVEIASEFRYKDTIFRDNCLAIFISQSGETADTLAALRNACDS